LNLANKTNCAWHMAK